MAPTGSTSSISIAAFRRGSNAALLASLVDELAVAVQLSGGIDDDASLAAALATGAARVVVAATALADPAWCARVVGDHGDRIAVALDVRVDEQRDGSAVHRIAPRGGRGDLGELWPALDRLDRAGCARYVVTDVTREGRLRGPGVALYRTVTAATPAPVIASGGIATLHDLAVLAGLRDTGADVEGAIVGTALTAGRFTLPEAFGAVARASEGHRATDENDGDPRSAPSQP